MSIIVSITLAGVTPAEYDAVRMHCNHLDAAPEGGQLHAVWWEGDTCRILDAWESNEAFGAFAQHILGPSLAKAGVQAEPNIEFFPAHEVYAPRPVTVTVDPGVVTVSAL